MGRLCHVFQPRARAPVKAVAMHGVAELNALDRPMEPTASAFAATAEALLSSVLACRLCVAVLEVGVELVLSR